MEEWNEIDKVAPISTTHLDFTPDCRTTLIPLWLIHSYLYYELGTSIISDYEFDTLAKAIDDLWDTIEHRHKYLLAKGEVHSGYYMVGKFPSIVKGAANRLLEEYRKSQSKGVEMSINQRSKGQRGEREVISLLQPIVDEVYKSAGKEPPLLQRNLMQSDRGGFDIVGLSWMALEVKRHENITQYHLDQFWEQAKRQAKGEQIPVLLYRKNNVAWRVQMFGYLSAGKKKVRARVDISIKAFLTFFKTKLVEELSNG